MEGMKKRQTANPQPIGPTVKRQTEPDNLISI